MGNTTTNMVDWKERKGKVFMGLHLCYPVIRGARGSSGTALQAGRLRVRFPMMSFDVFHWNNPSDRTMALGSTQPL